MYLVIGRCRLENAQATIDVAELMHIRHGLFMQIMDVVAYNWKILFA